MFSSMNSVFSFFRMASRYPQRLIWGFVALVTGAGVNLLIPILFRVVVERAGGWASVSVSTWWWLIAILIFFQGITLYFRIVNFASIGHSIALDLRRSLFEQLIVKPVSFFDLQRTADLVNRLGADVQLVQSAVGTQLSVVARYSIQVVGGVLLMLMVSLRLSLAVVLSFPILIGVSHFLVKRLRGLTKAQQAALGDASRLADESFSGMKIVKAYGAEKLWCQLYFDKVVEVCQLGYRRTAVSSMFQSVVTTLLNLLLLALFLFALNLLSAAVLSPEDLIAFVMYGAIVTVSFALLVGSFSELVQASGALERVNEFFSEVKRGETRSIESSLELNAADGLREVVLKDIFFTYPARPTVQVLSGVSLMVRPGQTVALVGPSGAGKSAIAQLVMGFYEPDSGAIEIGATALSDSLLEAFRMRVGYVSQEALMFSASIAENLRIAVPDASDQSIWEVCELVNLSGFVRGLPDGIDTSLGESGAQLSGGQRQRLSIARALLRKPDLLVLDEATSGLDRENEAIVLQGLRKFRPDIMILLISHRYTSIRSADYVYVINDGRVVEEGGPDQLIEREGMFSYLVSDHSVSDLGKRC